MTDWAPVKRWDGFERADKQLAASRSSLQAVLSCREHWTLPSERRAI